jgi:hypothetical protein
MDEDHYTDSTPHASGCCYVDPNRPHPRAVPGHEWFTEFPWDELEARLGEAKKTTDLDYPALTTALSELLRWIVQGNKLETVGRRAVALCWTLNPDTFSGQSSASVARQFEESVDMMHRATAESRRKFCLCNHGQSHGWNFKPTK